MTIVRKLKKSLLIVCLILLVCLVVPLRGVFAAGNATLTIETIDAENGEEVKLAVTLSNNPGICAFRLAINYDKELTLIGVSDTKLYGDHMFGNDLNANPYILMWDESLKTKSNKSEGVLAYLTFRVDKDAASGTHKVWITYNTGDIYDLNLKDIDVQLVEGGVTVKNASVTAIPTNIATNIPTLVPTNTPTLVPTGTLTPVPTNVPTPVSTSIPTQMPTGVPTWVPTGTPTPVPTDVPTRVPTGKLTPVPTNVPTLVSTSIPTQIPISTPTSVPTIVQTPEPTGTTPTHVPTSTLTPVPTIIPTNVPTIVITGNPAHVVTGTPTPQPSVTDSVTPTEVEIPKVTDTPINIKPFTVTIKDEYAQTVKYKIIPESDKTGSVAGKATIVSLKASKKSIIIPDSVEMDGKWYNVTAIGKNALKVNKKATKLQIGANVNIIGNNAFKGLKKIKTITINSGKITEVRTGAFSGIAKKATISIKANKTAYKNIVTLIKESGIGKKVTFKRIK